jgi:DNA-binding NtrC family response regulator
MADTKGSILIIDDDRIIVDSLSGFLKLEGYEVEGGSCFDDTMTTLARKPIDVVISDMNMPGTDGFELLRVVKQRYPDIMVIIMTGYGTIESAVEAIKMGAYDYLTKPIIDDEMRLVVHRAMEQRLLVRECQVLREQLDLRYGLDNVVGHDYKMLRVFDLISAVSASTVNVLVEGESGTGKSMIARAIHHRSDRRDKPFVEMSCGSIPETLLESELFGHARGAFTGAVADKQGKFKAADGGTLFLDEIDAASPALQVKLLRVLQEREFEPVGSNKTEKVDVRVVLATNKNLEKLVAEETFRQDLYYRINVVTISLPRLAERIGDIPLLAERFLTAYAAKSRKPMTAFTDDAIACMQRYDWPGNVRELENAVERAVVLATSRTVDVGDLPPKVVASADAPRDAGSHEPLSLKEALAEPERRVIEAALRHNNWCRQATADELDINRTTLYKKMKRYGLDVDPASAAYAGAASQR